jgi:clan AA aspartic protease (TIGR02281 family)
MTRTVADSAIQSAGGWPLMRWPQVAAAVASALLLLAASSSSRADGLGSFLGGVVGGIFGNAQQQQQQQYQLQQQRYQQQQQYYQQQYYQQQYYYQEQQRERAAAAAAARRRQAEIKRQKQQQGKANKEQEQVNVPAAASAAGSAAGPFQVSMIRRDGNLWVPAQINNVVTIDFVIDSGASDITLPWDTYLTLLRSGTLTKTNYIGEVNFGIANGSEVRGHKFKLASLQVGNQVLTDVVASVMPSDSATPLLGLSFLSRFQSWSIDNKSSVLTLVPLNANPAGGTATQLAASATAQSLPAFGTIAPAVSQSPTPALAATAAPQTAPGMPAAPQTPATSQTGAMMSQPQSGSGSAAAPVPQAPATTAMPTPAPGRELVALDKPRSALASSSVFLATATSAPTTPPPAVAGSAPSAAPVTTAAVAVPPPAKAETAATLPVFPASTPYANARVDLIALGYAPTPLPDAGKCDSTSDSTCFPERMACAKADGIKCDFLWRRGEQVIKVRTDAIPPTVSSVECQVNCK